MTQLGRERGWGPMTRAQFDALAGLNGAVAVGSPEQVAEKILSSTRSSATSAT
jgi:alkanesulfonate monooxygenase SsuD/methylene tetrahydromethanopterin reductase-like flavin-dependent oxidoreductase (luciferase family)